MNKNKSLWELTQNKKQPLFQYLDQETIYMIQSHRPIFYDEPNSLEKIDLSWKEIDEIKELIPNETVFLEKKMIHSIHGISHAIRVMIYTSMICRNLDIQDNQKRLLLIAASIHDSQRLNDQTDIEHSLRAIDFLEKTNKYAHEDLKILEDILLEKNEISEILRTADALDRYRLAKCKWWINDELLQIKPSSRLKSFAFDLIMKSEIKILQSYPPDLAVFSSF